MPDISKQSNHLLVCYDEGLQQFKNTRLAKLLNLNLLGEAGRYTQPKFTILYF